MRLIQYSSDILCEAERGKRSYNAYAKYDSLREIGNLCGDFLNMIGYYDCFSYEKSIKRKLFFKLLRGEDTTIDDRILEISFYAEKGSEKSTFSEMNMYFDSIIESQKGLCAALEVWQQEEKRNK